MNLEPKKSLGQNFLVDQKVAKDLVAAGEIGSEDTVIEVGAGTGVLTKELGKRAKKVIAVEFDRDLIPILEENLKELRNVEVVNKDILDLPINDYLPTRHPELDSESWRIGDDKILKQVQDDNKVSFKVVGSIPYQITSPLIHKLMIEEPHPSLIVFLIQLEVAEKICTQPPKATYLSNFVAAFGKANIVRKVPPSAFKPQPKVNSAILKITLDPKCPALDDHHFSKFLHHGFKNPRKMINKAFTEETLKKVGINATRRPQTLSLEEWQKLYYRIKKDKL